MNAPATNPARKRLLLATGAFVLIAIAYGIWWALFGAHFENTDDAYVHGNLVQITPQVHHRRHRGRRHRNRERRPAAGASRFRRHRRGAATGPGQAGPDRAPGPHLLRAERCAGRRRRPAQRRHRARPGRAGPRPERRQPPPAVGQVRRRQRRGNPARRSRAEVRAVRPGPGQGRAGRRARQARHQPGADPGHRRGRAPGRAAGRRRPAQCLAGAIAHRAARAGRWRGGAPQRRSASVSPRAPR